MVTGGFDSNENTDSTEIMRNRNSNWTYVGKLPYARNGLRAATVANSIYLFVGAETDILKYEASNQSWVHYAKMTPKEGSKLEVSTVNCSVVQHYLTPTTIRPTTTTTTPTTTIITTTEPLPSGETPIPIKTTTGLSPSLHLNFISTVKHNIVKFWSCHETSSTYIFL